MTSGPRRLDLTPVRAFRACCRTCGVPVPFGPRTQAALIEAISDGYSHSDMTTLFMRAGVDQWDSRGDGITKATRAQRVIQGLRDDQAPSANSKAFELVAEVVKHGDLPASPFGPDSPPWWQPLIDALSSDGYDWDTDAKRLFPAAEGLRWTRVSRGRWNLLSLSLFMVVVGGAGRRVRAQRRLSL